MIFAGIGETPILDPRRKLCAPSPLLLNLILRATHERSDYANKIVAYGIYGKKFAEMLHAQFAAAKEQADAGAAELAATGEQPADRAEEVRGA